MHRSCYRYLRTVQAYDMQYKALQKSCVYTPQRAKDAQSPDRHAYRSPVFFEGYESTTNEVLFIFRRVDGRRRYIYTYIYTYIYISCFKLYVSNTLSCWASCESALVGSPSSCSLQLETGHYETRGSLQPIYDVRRARRTMRHWL